MDSNKKNHKKIKDKIIFGNNIQNKIIIFISYLIMMNKI
jgi:hypothetical protein